MKLYHATYSKLLRKIKKTGFLGNSPYKLWSDSNNRYVYLADDPDEAFSYAETALDEIENERLYDMLEDDDIVILEIDSSNLDLSKLQKDTNNLGGTTYQYEGVIPIEYIKKFNYNKWLNEVFKAAGVQLIEEQSYFTDWNSIKERVIERYIDARLDEAGMLCDDEYYIQEWLEQNASADMLEELYKESGETEINWVANYINKNANERGIVSKVVNNMISEYFDRISEDLQEEFEQNNLIYRMIDSDKSPKEIAQILKTNGTGNCWAKQEEYAKAYYGNGNYNEYCLIGEATMDNVNWETTIFLRMMAEEENEVRLRKDSPIHIVGIKYYHYNENNKLDKKDHMKVDMTLSVGHSYVFNESEQVNESIAYAEMNDDEMMVILHNPTRKELKDNNLDGECRIVNDGNGGYYFASSQWTHEQIENKLKSKNLPYEETMGEFYYYQDNLFATRDDWNTEEEYQEYKNDWYKSLKSIPYIVKNFGDFKAEIFNGEYLTEEIIHAEKSNYDDYMAVVLKNPTRRELRDNGLERSRFICFEDGTWLFFDSMQWIHAHIWDKYKDKFNGSNNMGFYDLSNNEFIFIESLDYDEDEEGYEEEVSYYENKCKKWLLTKPYIRETFGLNPNVTVYGDWVDNPW